MTNADQFIMALTIWRENRGGGYPGMQSIANVILNRSNQRGTSPYEECIRPWQFSSLTAKGDPELTLWPSLLDTSWAVAQAISQSAVNGTLDDITGGANLYYNPNSIVSDQTFTLPTGQVVKFPTGWNPSVVKYLKSIENHLFFKE